MDDCILIFTYESLAMGSPKHKISYIRYDMKSSKVILWSRWDCVPLVFDEIDSRNEMQWNPWLEGVVDDLL